MTPAPAEPVTVLTVGHGTLAADALTGLLRAAAVDHLVDVRSFPASRRNPQHRREELARWLPEAGIAYTWEPRLGGRRRGNPSSPNGALRNQAFRAYADHMATADFRAGLDTLVALATRDTVAVMCAESVWWRCHRRLLADALVVLRSVSVEHLFHDDRREVHVPSPEARRVDDRLVYDRVGA